MEGSRAPETRAKRTSLDVAALFAGIGGIEVGLERAGHRTRLFCENDPAALAVLRHQFGKAGRKYPVFHEDVRTLAELPPGVDMITAGFPCQDLSQAGRTTGINGTQSGLVGHVFRLLRDHRVPWLLLENVPFMLQLDRGEAMTHLVRSLESVGYRWAYRVVDSRAFGLPQRRLRVFMLASRVADPARVLFKSNETPLEPGDHRGKACGFYWTEGTRGLGWAIDAVPTLKKGSTLGIPSPPAIWMPDGEILIGSPDIRDAERLQGFDEDWTAPAAVVEGKGSRYRWALVGNAVTTHVAEWVGRALTEPPGEVPHLAMPLSPGVTWPIAAFGGPGMAPQSAIRCTTWPLAKPAPALRDFLRFPLSPLSEKATSGFKRRLQASTLKRPDEFDDALARHLERLRGPAHGAYALPRPSRRRSLANSETPSAS